MGDNTVNPSSPPVHYSLALSPPRLGGIIGIQMRAAGARLSILLQEQADRRLPAVQQAFVALHTKGSIPGFQNGPEEPEAGFDPPALGFGGRQQADASLADQERGAHGE